MTINYARESVIDFTKPFMNLGISILFKVSRLIENPISLSVNVFIYVHTIVARSHTKGVGEGMYKFIEKSCARCARGDEVAEWSDYATGAASASGVMPSRRSINHTSRGTRDTKLPRILHYVPAIFQLAGVLRSLVVHHTLLRGFLCFAYQFLS